MNPKNYIKSMSVKKSSYLGQIILGLRRSDVNVMHILIKCAVTCLQIKDEETEVERIDKSGTDLLLTIKWK